MCRNRAQRLKILEIYTKPHQICITDLESAGDGAHYAQDVYRHEGSVDSRSRVVSVFKRMTHRQIALQSDQYQVPNYKTKVIKIETSIVFVARW